MAKYLRNNKVNLRVKKKGVSSESIIWPLAKKGAQSSLGAMNKIQ